MEAATIAFRIVGFEGDITDVLLVTDIKEIDLTSSMAHSSGR